MSDQSKSLEEKWATWIICLSIVTFLICGAAIALLNLKRDVPIVQHKVILSTDTLGKEVYSKDQIDSLILVVQSQERALSQKYQYLMEERSKEESSKTLITFIVGAIISVCGFFGYKSFKDIKEHGAKIAENKAVETAKSTINEQLPDMMNNEMTKIYKGQSVEVIKQKLAQELTTTLESYIDSALAEKAEDIKAELIEQLNNPEVPVDNEIKEEVEEKQDSSSLFDKPQN